jgi:hypothetical protein
MGRRIGETGDLMEGKWDADLSRANVENEKNRTSYWHIGRTKRMEEKVPLGDIVTLAFKWR